MEVQLYQEAMKIKDISNILKHAAPFYEAIYRWAVKKLRYFNRSILVSFSEKDR